MRIVHPGSQQHPQPLAHKQTQTPKLQPQAHPTLQTRLQLPLSYLHRKLSLSSFMEISYNNEIEYTKDIDGTCHDETNSIAVSRLCRSISGEVGEDEIGVVVAVYVYAQS